MKSSSFFWKGKILNKKRSGTFFNLLSKEKPAFTFLGSYGIAEMIFRGLKGLVLCCSQLSRITMGHQTPHKGVSAVTIKYCQNGIG